MKKALILIFVLMAVTAQAQSVTKIVDKAGNAINPATSDNQTNGNQITQVSSMPTVTVEGDKTPSDAYGNPSDSVCNHALISGWNGSTWNRISSAGNTVDNVSTLTVGVLKTQAYLYGFNGTTFDRLRSDTTNGLDVDVTRIQGSNACVNPSATISSLSSSTSGTNATQIIALSGTTKIYICSLTVIGVSGTSPTFSLVQGTGSNCASSQTTLVQAFGTTAGQLYAFANPVAVSVAGNAVCYKDGGTTPVQDYTLTYVQQ